jgi:hypothetical protein
VSQQILSHADLLNLQTYTYSTIFQKVLKNCGEKQIDPENVMLGIYSCQERYDKYIPEYNQLDIRDMIPKYANISLEHASTLNSINDYSENAISFPCFIIDNNPSKNWTALGNIKTQGCGLNILSYYGIIPQSSTREEITCLSVKGTSIFRILDYINKYYFIQKYENNIEYVNKREMNDHFYKPIFTKVYDGLQPGGYFIINVCSEVYQRVLIELFGNAHEMYPYKKSQRQNKYSEMVYVWRKNV